MEFDGQYLTYEEYEELGGSLDETPFNILEFEARKKIDINTQNRLKNTDHIPNEVKLCVFNLIDKIQSYVMENNKGVASENIDGYSISYISGLQIQEALKSKEYELDEIISTYLFGVIVNDEHLIYLGVK